MSPWERALARRTCGGCGAAILRGDPVLVIAAGRRATLLRCGTCREAPADLPLELEHDEPAPLPPVTWARFGLLPMDYAQRAAGERDPGEEG